MHNIINLKRKRLYKTLLSCMYEAHQNCKQIQYFGLCPIAKISIYVYGRIWKSFNILQVEIQNPPSQERCGSKRFNTYHSFLLFFFSCDKSPLPALDTNMAKCFPSYTGSLELLLLVLPFDYFPSLNLETSLFLVEAQRKIYCSVPPQC